MAAAVEAAEAEESITAVLFSVGLCTLAQTKEFTIINSHNLFHMFWSERWPQRYLWTTEGRLQRAVATWRAWTCSPLLCSGSSSSRNAAAADGCCNHHQAGGVWGRVGEPSEGLPAREHRYSIAASTLSYPLLLLRSKRGTKLTEPWGGRNNPLLPCMSDAASTKRHLATLLSCTIINRHLKISFSCSCQ